MLLSPPGVRFFLFSLVSSFSIFWPRLSLCFLSPPRHPFACISLSFVLFRPCSSYLSFLSTYAFLLLNLIAALLISCRILCHFRPDCCFIVSLILFSGLACDVSSYPVRWYFTCSTHEFTSIFSFGYFCLGLFPMRFDFELQICIFRSQK